MNSYENFKKLLLENGFSEATEHKGNFYKEMMPYTAFAVNITDYKAGLGIDYGCASTAFTRMKSNERAMITSGVYEEYFVFHRRTAVSEDEDTSALEREIREMYAQYKDLDKDALLAAGKEKRKAFISKFAVPLKSLGLRKKGNSWTLPSGEEVFYLQKSLYSDSYYFELNGNRIQIPGFSEPVMWQLLDENVLDDFIENTVVKILKSTLN